MKTLNPVLQSLADRWWVPLTRGLAAVLFGVLTLLMPGLSLFTLVVLWGAYALADGLMSIGYSIAERKTLPGWGWLLFEGLAGIAAGVFTFVWPGITAVLLLLVIAMWAVVIGALQIALAIVWPRELTGEWRLVLSGILSILFGLGAMVFPGAGALSVAWQIGAWAIAFGALMLAMSVRLYRLGHPRGRATPAAAAHPA